MISQEILARFLSSFDNLGFTKRLLKLSLKLNACMPMTLSIQVTKFLNYTSELCEPFHLKYKDTGGVYYMVDSGWSPYQCVSVEVRPEWLGNWPKPRRKVGLGVVLDKDHSPGVVPSCRQLAGVLIRGRRSQLVVIFPAEAIVGIKVVVQGILTWK